VPVSSGCRTSSRPQGAPLPKRSDERLLDDVARALVAARDRRESVPELDVQPAVELFDCFLPSVHRQRRRLASEFFIGVTKSRSPPGLPGADETNPCSGASGTIVDDEQDVFHITELAKRKCAK
jgi:hypothetical protein